MEDKISDLLAQSDLAVYRAGRVKGAWILETDKGLKHLGLYSYSEGKATFEQKVKQFAAEVQRCGVPIRLSPAWLVSPEDDNPYNRQTREVLAHFAEMKIPVGEGNIVFPEGNACRNLAEYFTDVPPENPYVEDPCDVRCVSFSANGDVLNGNVYRQDIMEIFANYAP